MRTAAEFDALLVDGVASRKIGSSTVHDLSSRSHAVIELEVVSSETARLEDAIAASQESYNQMANARDDGLRERYKEQFAAGGQAAVEQSGLLKEMEEALGAMHVEGTAAIEGAREALDAHLKGGLAVVRGKLAFIDMAGNDCARGAGRGPSLCWLPRPWLPRPAPRCRELPSRWRQRCAAVRARG